MKDMIKDLATMMSEDAAVGQFTAPTNDDLASVGALANEQLKLENEIESLESELANRKKDLAIVSEVTLPNALERFGLTEIRLLDGSRVTVKEEVYASITDEHKAAAFEWLLANGHDGIIKNKVEVPFGKGQDSEASRLLSILNEGGYSYTNNRGVHPQTLKAFVKRQIEDGQPVPTDIFSIHVRKVSKISQAKPRKG